jgi:hypothetical protein
VLRLYARTCAQTLFSSKLRKESPVLDACRLAAMLQESATLRDH